MSKKFGLILFLVIFLFSACTPATVPAPKLTSTSVLPTLTTTVTLPPSATLKQDAILYAGPGNADFDSTATLKAGTTVVPLGTFGDFIQASATVDNQEVSGYLWKDALEALPAGLPELTSDQVPWQPLYLPECSPGNYNAETDAVVFSNDSNSYLDNESNAIPLSEPLSISIANATVAPSDGAPAIKILGIPEQATSDWWKGITRLDLGYVKGNYYIGIRDGTKADDADYLELPIKANQPIQLVFDQPEGKSFRILDGNGQEIQSVDLTATPGLNLPNGLFPKGVAYIGTTLPPKSSFTLTALRIGVPASGKWVDAQNGYYTQPGLAALAAPRHITIGTEFTAWAISDPRYCRTMQREFNLAVLSEFS